MYRLTGLYEDDDSLSVGNEIPLLGNHKNLLACLQQLVTGNYQLQ
jgi:hypothetical protein